MIESLARVLSTRITGGDGSWRSYVSDVRALLKHMERPTARMVDAGWLAMNTPTAHWTAMVRAAGEAGEAAPAAAGEDGSAVP